MTDERLPVANLYPDPPLLDRWLNVPGHLCRKERWKLHDLALDHVRTACLEIGSWLGAGLGCLLSGTRGTEAKVFSIDLYNEDALQRQMLTLEAYDVDSTRLIRYDGPSQEIGKHWAIPLDLVFIDGSHEPEDLRQDLDLFAPHVGLEGVMILHDSRMPDEDEIADRVNRLYNLRRLSAQLRPAIEGWLVDQMGAWCELEPCHSMRVFRRKVLPQ